MVVSNELFPETQASDLRYFEQKISSITSKYRRVFAWGGSMGGQHRWVEGIARHEFQPKRCHLCVIGFRYPMLISWNSVGISWGWNGVSCAVGWDIVPLWSFLCYTTHLAMEQHPQGLVRVWTTCNSQPADGRSIFRFTHCTSEGRWFEARGLTGESHAKEGTSNTWQQSSDLLWILMNLLI